MTAGDREARVLQQAIRAPASLPLAAGARS